MKSTILRHLSLGALIAAAALSGPRLSAQPPIESLPTFTGLIDQTIFANQPLDITFGAVDPDPGDIAALILSIESLTPAIFAGPFTLTGEGTSTFHLIWNPLLDATGEASLRFRLTDPTPFPSQATRTVKVTVLPAPDTKPPVSTPDTGRSALLLSLSCGSLLFLRRSQKLSSV